MIYLLLFNAIALSVIAEYYAIMGLMAIFSGSPIAIAVMGGILGLSKVVITSWLYRNWKSTTFLLKSYFSTAIVILMFLTSMGIFGYLSKAHLDQGVVSGDVSATIALLDEKINIQKENINAARKALNQLDSQVEATLSRTTDAAGATRSATLRRNQSKERGTLLDDISAAQREIARLTEEKAPIAAELRKVEAEVGPIKYIAAFVYEEQTDQTALEKAVRWLILLIVIVFDPLAVLMFVAVNQSMMKREQENQSSEPAPAPPVEVKEAIKYVDDSPEHIYVATEVKLKDKIEIVKF